MDFIDRVRELSVQIPKIKQQNLIKTEEGTKTALVMPFINALGYNVFDPTEVTPELVADVGTKKGEKVDYAILKDGKPIMLFECKCCGTNLNDVHASQLYRYFSVTEARFGILTDGVVYHFYTDLEAPNKMDSKPFLVFDMLDVKEPLVDELKKFTKSAFDVEQIMSTASELKYTSAIKRIITAQLSQPTEDFVRFFASQVYMGRMTQNVLAQFTEITKRAWREVITDRMKETFTKAALAEEATPSPDEEADTEQPEATTDKIVTTEEELDGYRIVQAIVREVVEVNRVIMRDAQSYCAILLDDNNRKTICRLHFNTSKKYIGIFDHEKKEEKIPLEKLEDIFKYSDRLKASVTQYLQPTTTP
jgi:hypothetical protein